MASSPWPEDSEQHIRELSRLRIEFHMDSMAVYGILTRLDEVLQGLPHLRAVSGGPRRVLEIFSLLGADITR